MFFNCERCNELGAFINSASSSFYVDISPGQKPTFKWYRPSLEHCLKLRTKNPNLLEHILDGGLDYERI